MIELILYSVFSVIISAVILAFVAFSLLKASKSDFHPILIFGILIVGLLLILIGSYRIIIVGLDYYEWGSDSLFGGFLSVYGDISQNIWFNIGSTSVNYSIVRGGITIITSGGVLLVVVRFVVNKLKN